MIEYQRKRVFELRSQGLGYKAIAREVGLSSDTVKGYCKHHHLNGPGEVVKLNIQVMEENQIICPQCKKEIKQKVRGRSRRFCSNECRRKWWHEHPQARKKKETAMYKYICPRCGEEFTCYGNKKRKYCSHDCYIQARYWSDEDGIYKTEDR